jgi:hypothetical protein
MDKEQHPHLRLIKESPSVAEPKVGECNHDSEYKYELGMSKGDVKIVVICSLLIGGLLSIVTVWAVGVLTVI